MLKLTRVGSGNFGTLGVLWYGGIPWGLTLEPKNPIPTGTYQLSVYHSPKNGFDVYLLASVPGFDYIEIHPGNTYADTEGCILVGRGIDNWSGNLAVIDSKLQFNKLMALPKQSEIKIS